DLGGVAHVVERDRRGAALADVGQDPARRLQQGLPSRLRVVDRRQRQGGLALEEIVRVFEVRTGERRRGDQLRGPHAPVLVGVDQRERAGVDLQAGGGAGEGDPQL